MDQNLSVVGKKFWKIVRVALCMLRKDISNQKIMLDIKFMVKRSKIGSYKASVQNVTFHNCDRSHDVDRCNLQFSPPEDEYYEFSCSSSPNLNFKKHTSEKDFIVTNEAPMKMIMGETMSSSSPDNYLRGFRVAATNHNFTK